MSVSLLPRFSIWGLWHLVVIPGVSGGVCLIVAAIFYLGLWHLVVIPGVSGGVCLIAAAIFVLVCRI